MMRERMVDRASSPSTALTRPFVERAGAAKRESEALGGDRFWQGFAGHLLAILAWKTERLQIVGRGASGGGELGSRRLIAGLVPCRSLIRRHSPSKDGRLSTPYGATFSQREKSPRAPRLPGPKGKIFEQSLFKIQNSC
jgi:hypothetical protein